MKRVPNSRKLKNVTILYPSSWQFLERKDYLDICVPYTAKRSDTNSNRPKNTENGTKTTGESAQGT